MKNVYYLLRSAMQKRYRYVYTSEFQDTAEKHKEWLGEDVTESINLVLAGPPYNTHHKSSRENDSYENLT